MSRISLLARWGSRWSSFHQRGPAGTPAGGVSLSRTPVYPCGRHRSPDSAAPRHRRPDVLHRPRQRPGCRRPLSTSGSSGSSSRGLIQGYGATVDLDQLGLPLTRVRVDPPDRPVRARQLPVRLSGTVPIESCWSVPAMSPTSSRSGATFSETSRTSSSRSGRRQRLHADHHCPHYAVREPPGDVRASRPGLAGFPRPAGNLAPDGLAKVDKRQRNRSGVTRGTVASRPRNARRRRARARRGATSAQVIRMHRHPVSSATRSSLRFSRNTASVTDSPSRRYFTYFCLPSNSSHRPRCGHAKSKRAMTWPPSSTSYWGSEPEARVSSRRRMSASRPRSRCAGHEGCSTSPVLSVWGICSIDLYLCARRSGSVRFVWSRWLTTHRLDSGEAIVVMSIASRVALVTGTPPCTTTSSARSRPRC